MDSTILGVLQALPGAKATWRPAVERGALEGPAHYRIEFEGWKTAILVIQYSNGAWEVGASRNTLKKLPAPIRGSAHKWSPNEIERAVTRWMKKYLKAYPVIPMGPTVKQVMDHVYYGAPLKDVYYK